MDQKTLLPDNLTECARIYMFVTDAKTKFYLINCLFCNKDYGDWLKFYNHLHEQHLANAESEEEINSENLEETFRLDHKTNMETDVKTNDSDETSNIRCGQTLSYDNKEFLEDYIKTDFEYYNKNVASEKPAKLIESRFFRLHTTDSKIMFKFIELLSKHPSQWEYTHNIDLHKDKLYVSTVNLTEQLKECLKLNVTPQGTRISVLFLLRWFEGEYIRLLNCQQNGYEFISLHPEYFEKLLKFLPFQHLKPVKCKKCSKHFKSEHLLMAHKHKYHNGQVPFRCRYCGRGFIHQSSHRLHENRHIKLHIWLCNICLYQGVSKSDYTKHLLTHSPQKPFKCGICGLSYKTKTNLNVHLKSHSLPAYECEWCKKKFYEKYRYKRHIWLHEEQEMPGGGKTVDNFTCDICGRRFTSNKTLMKHQLVHMQESYTIEDEGDTLIDVIVFYCDYCSLEFVQEEAYETHMNLKHNEGIQR